MNLFLLKYCLLYNIIAYVYTNKQQESMKTKFEKGQKVKYLGHEAKITSVIESFGDVFYSLKYFKGQTFSVHFVSETDGSITE